MNRGASTTSQSNIIDKIILKSTSRYDDDALVTSLKQLSNEFNEQEKLKCAQGKLHQSSSKQLS